MSNNNCYDLARYLSVNAFLGAMVSYAIGCLLLPIIDNARSGASRNAFCKQVIANNCTVDQRYEAYDDDATAYPRFPTCDNFQGSTLCDIQQQTNWFDNAARDKKFNFGYAFIGLMAAGIAVGLLVGLAKYLKSRTAEMRRMASTTDAGTPLLADTHPQTSLSPRIVSLFNPTQAASNRGVPLMSGQPQDYATLTHH
jgi:hypothetical protein